MKAASRNHSSTGLHIFPLWFPYDGEGQRCAYDVIWESSVEIEAFSQKKKMHISVVKLEIWTWMSIKNFWNRLQVVIPGTADFWHWGAGFIFQF